MGEWTYRIMPSQNIYEYKKITPLDIKQMVKDATDSGNFNNYITRAIINKVNELTIEQNRLMKDFELYKKAFKEHSHADHYFTPAQ